MISRRKLLKASAAAGVVCAQPKIAHAGMFFSAGKLRSPYQAKRTTLMMIGASVCWGNGVDQTESYATLMQNKIDTTLSTPLGGWTARCIHTDDWQAANNGTAYVYPSVPSVIPTNVPMNGQQQTPGFSTGDCSQVVNYTSGHAPCLNPTVPTAYTTQGSSKLNFDSVGGVAPTAFDGGIFYNYGGIVGSGTAAASIRLNGTGQNIRFAANSPTFLFIGVIGTGSASVFGCDSTGSCFLGTTISNSSSSGISLKQISFTPTGTPPQSFAINWASGTLDICVLWPTRTQATNGISVQVCARNSYSIQDYIGNSPFTGKTEPITGQNITTLIRQSVINQLSNGFSSPPIYLIYDSYNTMVQTGRILSPTNYATALNNFGLALAPTTADGRIILCMPFVETAGSPNQQYPTNSSGFSPSDYRTAIYNLAVANSWDVIDESVLPSITQSNWFYADNLHPQSTVGVSQLANLYIGALGL